MKRPQEFLLANKQHPHTRAVHLATESMNKVIESFKSGPKFMQDSVSPRTQARREAIANASPDIQALNLPDHIIARLAKE